MLLFYFTILNDPCDSDKFEALYKKHRAKMIRIAYGVLHDFGQAEDAVHNAFVSVANNINKIDDPNSYKSMGYVCRAAKTSAINLYNKEKRRNENEEFLPEDDIIGTEDEILNKICSDESVERIVGCIRALPDAYRDVLYLYFVEELTNEKISRKLDLNKDTVKKRVSRGKKMLIDMLCEKGGTHVMKKNNDINFINYFDIKQNTFYNIYTSGNYHNLVLPYKSEYLYGVKELRDVYFLRHPFAEAE